MDEEPTIQEVEQHLNNLKEEEKKSQDAIDPKVACEDLIKLVVAAKEPLTDGDNEWKASAGDKICGCL